MNTHISLNLFIWKQTLCTQKKSSSTSDCRSSQFGVFCISQRNKNTSRLEATFLMAKNEEEDSLVRVQMFGIPIGNSGTSKNARPAIIATPTSLKMGEDYHRFCDGPNTMT